MNFLNAIIVKSIKALHILKAHPDIPAKAFARFYFDDPKYEYLFTASSNNGHGNSRGKKAWLCAGSLLGRLVKKGYVERTFHKDGSVRFKLTKKGLQYLSEHESEARLDRVTSVDESLALIAIGRDIYTAQWYWEKSGFPADKPWYLHPVPMADKQLEMDEYDRFFKVYHDDIRRGRIIPAWSK